MNEHVVDYRESGHPEGLIAVLPPHDPAPLDWTDDGITCAPSTPCSAIATSSNARCGKREAVVLLVARAKFTAKGSGSLDVFLCGGHFNAHRSGTVIRIVVTPGRLR
jgi:hypothetical protein